MDLPSAPFALAATLVGLGVHVSTALVLLTLDARNRAIRWYVGFIALMVGWLASEGAQLLWSVTPGATVGVLAHLLPLSLLLFALVVTRDVPARRLAGVGAAAAACLPFTLAVSPWYVPVVDATYQGLTWTAAALALAFRPARAGVVEPRARRRVRIALVVVAFAIVAFIHGPHDVAVVVPVLSSVAQGLVLFGATRLQLYGLAERAVRTGALARDAAEFERLALLGEVGATVAHEVRNPLTGIRSVAQRMADGEALSPERRARFARLIVDEVDRLDRFVGSMLTLARGEAAPARERAGATDVPALLGDLQVLVAAQAARRGVRIVTRGAGVAAVPRGPLAQALLNLLLNAIDHSPADGTVTVDVRPTAGGLAVGVHDDGPGLSDEARAHLFQAFAPGARGTGLGLAVVRRVADDRGWRVTVAQGTDGAPTGTTFTVTVPA